MIRSSRELTADHEITCDVCVIGSGAGGAVLAAGLAERGLKVVVLEEGGHHTSADFRRLDEAWSLPTLYQERGARATADLAITVLQGRSVGGGTTVNWTTCFRTPDRILSHWATKYGLEGLTSAAMAPHFEAVEARLGIQPWGLPPNHNNEKLRLGGERLGIATEVLRRNVRGCADSGYCGFGCPFDAKQAMHLTYVPDAIAAGAELWSDTRADRLVVEHGRVVEVQALAMTPDRDRPGDVRIRVRPKLVAVCGGAINTPALLLRSELDGPAVGRRTFLHPVVAVLGDYDEPVRPFSGAPQSVGSHAFADRGEGEVGVFLEHAPLHPMMAGSLMPVIGAEAVSVMGRLAHLSSMISLSIDGLSDGDEGGTVRLRSDGRVRLDYPILEPLIRSFRFAHQTLARLQFAAGAREVLTLHRSALRMQRLQDVAMLDGAAYGAHEHRIFSAHQMGGCAMGTDPEHSVVDAGFRHHGVPNLFVVDGSVLPTSLGVNPSETIYALSHHARDLVAAAV